MLALLALHYVTPDEKRFWSHAAVLFALRAAEVAQVVFPG